MDTNPYAPPTAAVADVARQEAAAATSATPGFPFLLLLRWVLASALLLIGISRLYNLSLRWNTMVSEMVYGPEYSPYPWLAIELAALAAGVLLWFRSRWVLVAVLLHIVLFSWKVLAGAKGIPVLPLVYIYWCIQTLVLAFCLLLLSRGRLR